MNKITITFVIILSTSSILMSCQRTKGPEEKNKPAQTVSDTTGSGNMKQETLPKSERAVESKNTTSSTPVRSLLTEAEQNEFKLWRDKQEKVNSVKDAEKFLDILFKGRSDKGITWYVENQEIHTGTFEQDACELFKYLVLANSESAYAFAAKFSEDPWLWHEILYCVIPEMRFIDPKKSIPFVRSFINYHIPQKTFPNSEEWAHKIEKRFKYESTKTLFALGDADTALPVVAEMIEKDQAVAPLYYLFKGPGKIYDERGYGIVENALSSPKAELRITAVIILLDANRISQEEAESQALSIVTNFKNKALKDYGLMRDSKKISEVISIPGSGTTDVKSAEQLHLSNSRSCEASINLLAKLKSKKAVSLLKDIERSNLSAEVWYNCKSRNAKDALLSIDGSEQ